MPQSRLASPTAAIAALLALLLAGPAVGQAPASPGRRAAPPKFNEAEVSRIFFKNAFQEGLEGERPAQFGRPAPLAAASPVGPAAPAQAAPSGGGGTGAWTSVISPTTIEDEIKSIKLASDQQITTPSQFRGNGYKWVRREFSVLAMLFGVIAQYDGDVRWKSQAPAARDVFARTARNAKVGTDQVYAEARQRRDQLTDLLNGSQIGAEASPDVKLGAVADRSPLMQKLDLIMNGPLRGATSNESEFKANRDKLLHQAEIVAAISQVLHEEGMDDAGDETYDGFCQEMKKAALDIVDAVKLNSYEQARAAVGAIDQACSKCHENYR